MHAYFRRTVPNKIAMCRVVSQRKKSAIIRRDDLTTAPKPRIAGEFEAVPDLASRLV